MQRPSLALLLWEGEFRRAARIAENLSTYACVPTCPEIHSTKKHSVRVMRSFFPFDLSLLLFGIPSLAFAQEKPEREFKECADCPTMVGIPAGKFAMGSPASETGRFDAEGP